MTRECLQFPLPPEFLCKDARRSIVATVFDVNGLRLPGYQVAFRAEGPGGFAGTGTPLTTARTDHDGDALVTWQAAPASQALVGAPIRITARCTEGRAERVQLSEAVPPLLAFNGH